MATELERLSLLLEVQSKQYENQMRKLNSVTEKNFNAIVKRADNMESSVSAALGKLGPAAAAAAASVASVLSVNKVREYADAWTDMANKIAASSDKINDVAAVQNKIADIALATRSDLGATATLYAGLTQATQEMGASQAQVARVVETVNKAFVAGGATASEAASGILQLKQALGSGVLQGDELRSIRENAPPIAQAIAKEFGVTIGELKKLGEDGELVATRVFSGLLKASGDIDAKFAKTNATVSQSFTNLSTALTRYVGQTDKAYGASRALAGGIQFAADNAETTSKALVVLGIALAGVGGAILGFSAVPAAILAAGTAVVLFSDQIHPIAGEIATIADYAAVAFNVVKEVSADAAQFLAEKYAAAADLVTQAFEAMGSGDTLGKIVEVVKQTVNSIIGAFSFCAAQIVTAWTAIGPGLAEVTVNAMNGVIATVENALKKIIGAINSAFSGIGVTALPIPEFGRIENAYAGAGAASAKAFGENFKLLSKDYVGDALGAASGALNKWADEANKRAMDRARRNFRASEAAGQSDMGSLDQKLKPGKPKEEKGGGGGKSEEDKAEDRLNRYIDSLARQNDVLKAEIDNFGKSNAEKRAAIELAKAGVDLNRLDATTRADMVRRLTEQTTKSEELRTKQKQLQDQQKAYNDASKFFGDAITDSLEDLIINGSKAEDVLKNLVKQLAKAALQAAIMGSGPLAGIFGTTGTNGAAGGIFGLIGGLFKGFDSGGYTGSGGKNQPAGVVHKGEYVFTKAQVKKLGLGNLEALSRGYAGGGPVGVPSVPAGLGGGSAPRIIVNNTQSENVQATPKQDSNGDITVLIAAVEGRIADNMLRGRGPMSAATQAIQTNKRFR